MALKVSLTISPDQVLDVPAHAASATEEEIAALQPAIDAALAHNAGTTYPEAYVRIMYVRSMAEESFVFVNWYADEAARQNEEPGIKVYEYKVDTDNLPGNIYPAAYAYLKTLPEFEGATDC